MIDPCAGSASTLIAAYGMGRHSYGFEIKKDFFKAASLRIGANKCQTSLVDPRDDYEQITAFANRDLFAQK